MKRLLLFLLLAACSLVALQLAVGEQAPTRANGKGDGKAPDRQQPNDGPSGITVAQGKLNASATLTGPATLPQWREVRTADGRVRKELVLEVAFEDSKPVGEGLQQLDRVHAKLYDDGQYVADLDARQAFAELGKDGNGRASLLENKELDLRDAVLRTRPGTRLAGLELLLGDARVTIGDDAIVMTTLPTQAVLMVLEGERKVTLRGLGAQARLPRSKDAELQRADIELLSEPVLESEGVTARARGRLHYVEDLRTGIASLVLQDHVQLDVQRSDLSLPGFARSRPAVDAAADTPPGRTTVRGDRFQAWLLRGKETEATDKGDKERQTVVWRQMVLHGAPTSVEVPGGRLTTPRLSVLPGLSGDAFLLTAHGGESRLEQTEPVVGKDGVGKDGKKREPMVATARRRIHLLRPLETTGAMHRAFGFPQWSLGAIADQQVVIAEGASHFEQGRRIGNASQGVRVFRRDGHDGVVVHGRGDVDLELRGDEPNDPPLLAKGSDGFLLVRGVDGDDVQLGPAAPAGYADLSTDATTAAWRAHRWDVRQADTHLHGRGSCRVQRRGNRSELDVLAPDAAIAGDVPGDGLQLRSVRQLRGTLVTTAAGSELHDLDLAGWPVEVTVQRGGEQIVARSPRLVQLGATAMRLLPVPADAPLGLWRDLAEADRMPQLRQRGSLGTTKEGKSKGDQEVLVRGPRIDVHHAGGRHVLVDAEAVGDDEPTIHARVLQADRTEPTTIACTAGRLRLLPFLLSPQARQFHTGSGASVLGDLTFQSLGSPWLWLEEVRDFQLDDPKDGHVDGSGHRLLVSQGARSALFVGDPDQLTPTVVRRVHEGREATMRGARVRVQQGAEKNLLAMGSFADRDTFLPPSVTLHELGKTGLLSHMQASCHGNIELRPDGASFFGPVVAVGLLPNGDVDPTGMRIEAQELAVLRNPTRSSTSDPKRGGVTKLQAKQVVLDWPRMQARTAELEIDVERQRCIARDPAGAEVAVPGWPTFRSPQVELNYATMTLRAPRLRAVQTAPKPPADVEAQER